MTFVEFLTYTLQPLQTLCLLSKTIHQLNQVETMFREIASYVEAADIKLSKSLWMKKQLIAPSSLGGHPPIDRPVA